MKVDSNPQQKVFGVSYLC